MTNDPEDLHLYVDDRSTEAQSDAWLFSDPELRDHVRIINHCFDVLRRLLERAPHRDENELSIFLLGIRIFNDASAALRCVRSGYYQPAFAMIRDVVETAFLLDYFKRAPDQIEPWRLSDSKTRRENYSPFKIRLALEATEAIKASRQEIYSWYCENASHPTPEGLELITQQNLAQIGGFPDLARLKLLMQDLTIRFAAATLSFVSHTAGSERSLQVFGVQIKFVCALRDWYRTYAPQFYEPMRDDIEKVRDLLAEDDPLREAFR